MENDEKTEIKMDEEVVQPQAEEVPQSEEGAERVAADAVEVVAGAEGGGELPDGAVEVAGEDAGEEDETGEEIEVDMAALEALIFSTHHPLTAGRLAELVGSKTSKPIRKAIKLLNDQYETSGRTFRVEQVAGGFQMLTLPEYGEYLKRLHQKEADTKLTKAALETLAIIAYKQPILRADVEAIRGVACGETIRSLMEKHLVKIAGRAEEPGRPILYGTTKRFLELFGLNNLKDLPQTEELNKRQKEKAKEAPKEEGLFTTESTEKENPNGETGNPKAEEV